MKHTLLIIGGGQLGLLLLEESTKLSKYMSSFKAFITCSLTSGTTKNWQPLSPTTIRSPNSLILILQTCNNFETN